MSMFVGWVGPKNVLCVVAFKNTGFIVWLLRFSTHQQSEALTLHILSMLSPLLFEFFFAKNHWVFLIYVPPRHIQVIYYILLLSYETFLQRSFDLHE